MNRAKLKEYARQARREFIQAVTDRAAYYGLTPKKTEPIIEKGDVALIGGRAFPRDVAQKRKSLGERISRHGFEQVMETMAYTWFNRLVAIRFMELHGYLDHGYRVLSHPERKDIPEILEHAEHVELAGIDRSKVIELKLEGTKEEELYRMLLIAQCNALHSAMPFLFEWINDETELLLPNNLLHSDSLIRKLINEIDEEDWQEVEIIGWLYQFYISEKKHQVIGKVVKSEDIPAATQLFTPNWIVLYLVQNSLGRQWLATYPDSPLRQQMAYYIEPAEQTLEVQVQLKAITPANLNPEEITFLDDACGSGHILTEAYDLFKAIYQERGYRAKDIPTLILQKNLFGLEIDDRAAQLAAFALMMKARADDHHIFASKVQPNILAIQESKGLDARQITEALNAPLERGEKKGQTGDIYQTDVAQLLELFEHGKTYGSLIRVPDKLAEKLSATARRVEDVVTQGNMFGQAVAMFLIPLVKQARLLASKYNVVVTNPPYMGNSGMNNVLKGFAKKEYGTACSDLFGMFIQRCCEFAESLGYCSMITMHSWMFLQSFRRMREDFLTQKTLMSLAHLGAGAFSSISGEVVQVAAFNAFNTKVVSYRPTFFRLVEGNEEQKKAGLLSRKSVYSEVLQDELADIPGAPLAYWINRECLRIFRLGISLGSVVDIRTGMSTSNNSRFLRMWHEVNYLRIGFGMSCLESAKASGKKWFPYRKGGEFRKWHGDEVFVLNWGNDGEEIKHAVVNNPSDPNTTHWSRRIFGVDFFFQPSVSWSKVSSSILSVRYTDEGSIISDASNGVFGSKEDLLLVAGYLNSRLASTFLELLNPTLNSYSGDIARLPYLTSSNAKIRDQIEQNCRKAVAYTKRDWDSCEVSWDFRICLLLSKENHRSTINESNQVWQNECAAWLHTLKELEEQNHHLFIEAYGLHGVIKPEVQNQEITLYQHNREEDIKRLISYAIGCMMGRYSLDKSGLVYAHSSNKDFDPTQYKAFPADSDGIIAITEGDWFHVDACNRLIEFIGVAWPKAYLEENLNFIADSLNPIKSEQPREAIRRYLATGFYKYHLSMYRRRPIYWLFCSGKLRAFQCLVYLHRYNESILSRMRTEYVIPLQGKIASRVEQLANDVQNATSTPHRKKMEKERDALIKQQAELKSFDEKLRHYADLRVSLDLDDGVKINYGKFGDLLAEVKTVTGGSDE
jgi:type II restriction/modification system DNA methylase subunit YeeA